MQDGQAKPALKKFQTYIDGKWVESRTGKTFPSFNPYTAEPWAEIPDCDAGDVERAVEAAHRAFVSGPWANMPQTARGKLLRRIADLADQHAAYLAEIEVRDNGKLISEMAAQTKFLVEWYHFFGGLADKITGSVVPIDKPEHFTYTLREPLGVCVFILPWNSPLLLVAYKLAAALATGNTVVIKPSEFTSASTLEFVRLVLEPAGVPPGVVNVVTGSGAVVGEPLVTHPKVAKVAFTGGSATGARVNELAARTFKKVSLELGGKSPNIVFDDAIIDDAVNGAVSGIFAASGQTCIAGSRLLLHEKIHDEFVEKLIKLASTAKLGDPSKFETQVGPVTTPPQYRRSSATSTSPRARAPSACSAAARRKRRTAAAPTSSSRRSLPASTTRCASPKRRCSAPSSPSSSSRTTSTRSRSPTTSSTVSARACGRSRSAAR